jgi:hypothetical protein
MVKENSLPVSRLGGVMVSVPAKVRGFKPCRRDGFLKMIKIRSTPSSGRKVKPEVPSRKILRPVPSALLLDDSACTIAREFWWTNQEFSSADIIPPWFSMLIYPLGDEQ